MKDNALLLAVLAGSAVIGVIVIQYGQVAGWIAAALVFFAALVWIRRDSGV